MASSSPTINIGTRQSTLAQIQARSVESALKSAFPDRTYAICPVLAQGDKDKVTPLQQLSQGENAKSLWTGELEAMLEKGELSFTVNCLKGKLNTHATLQPVYAQIDAYQLKEPRLTLTPTPTDMPTQLPDNLTIGAILEREDPRDALVVSPRLPKGTTIASLPPGSTIGTSSIRRAAQLRRLHPSLAFADLRGNLGTRLAKLDAEDSPFAAIILAAAGLKRIGWTDRISQYLSSDNGGMLWAVGQGALAVEIRKDDEEMKGMLAKIRCERTTRACSAERALLRALEGGCSVPIGVETSWRRGKGIATGAEPARDYDKEGQAVEEEEDLDEQELFIKTIVVSVDGKDYVEFETARKVRSIEEAETLGRDVAQILKERGAEAILEKISRDKQWDARKKLEQAAAA